MQIRQAAATARKQLLETAAQRLGVPATELVVEDGIVRRRSGGPGVGYGELVGGLGLSGAASTVDEQCAEEAAARAGLQTSP